MTSLTPADRTRLRTLRGEHLEGVEVVAITRADLDALLDAIDRVEELADELEAVVTTFPQTPAALFAGANAKRIRTALGAPE